MAMPINRSVASTADDRDDEDHQLLASDLVDVQELLGRRQAKAGVHQHRRQGRQAECGESATAPAPRTPAETRRATCRRSACARRCRCWPCCGRFRKSSAVRPPSPPAVLATPTATRSRFKFVLRFQGSSMSMALALSIDSSDPIRAKHQHPLPARHGRQGRKVGKRHRLEHVVGHVDQKRFAQGIGVRRTSSRCARATDRNRCPTAPPPTARSSAPGIILSPPVADHRQPEQDQQADRADQGDFRIGVGEHVRAARRRSRTVHPWRLSPIATGNCLSMMMMPIAANMPCTAEVGKKSPSMPARTSPKAIWITPAATPTASAMR